MLTVRLVTLLMATVLQTVPLQVLERGAAGGNTAVTSRLGQGGRAVGMAGPCPPQHPVTLAVSQLSLSPRQAGRAGKGGVGGTPPDWHLCTPKHSIQPTAPRRLLLPLGGTPCGYPQTAMGLTDTQSEAGFEIQF